MVTITASYIVTPNEETPKGYFWLSDSDQVVRWSHTPTIYIYKTKGKKHNHDDNGGVTIESLRDSLGKVLVHYYPVAGRLSWAEGGRLELDCNAKGVMLLEAQSDKSLAEYGDFSWKESIKELYPKVDYSQPIEELPLFLAQLTRFRDGEGVAIGVAFCHPVTDGLGAVLFVNAWAKIARGDMLGPNEIPFLDRTILKSPHPLSAPRFDHQELRPLPLKIGCSDTTAERKKTTTMTLLKLTPKQVEKLKVRANDDGQFHKQGSRPYSRFEAIGAHIWRCASLAWKLEEDQPTVVRFYTNFRNRLKPPLPQNYFGNALATAVTSPSCCAAEIVSKPLGYGAQKIREAVEMLTNEYIRSQLDFIRGQEKLDSMRPSHNEKGERMDVPFLGNPNLSLTSWMSMPVYDADFGWGKPCHFGMGAVSPFDRAVMVMSPEGDGSIVVFVHFQEVHMDNFLKFFWKDIRENELIGAH